MKKIPLLATSTSRLVPSVVWCIVPLILIVTNLVSPSSKSILPFGFVPVSLSLSLSKVLSLLRSANMKNK